LVIFLNESKPISREERQKALSSMDFFFEVPGAKLTEKKEVFVDLLEKELSKKFELEDASEVDIFLQFAAFPDILENTKRLAGMRFLLELSSCGVVK
jgi:hypothetical protein